MATRTGSPIRRGRRGMGAAYALVAAALVAGCCPPNCPRPPEPTAATPLTFCFAQATGVPYDSDPPTIDGMIAGNPGDLGWTSAFRYEFQNGSSIPYATVQGNREGGSLYLSFEVRNDATLDDKDAILLAFRPDGDSANDRRILIYPIHTTVGAAASGVPREVKYWTDSGTWNTFSAPTVVNPAWLVDNIRATSIAPSGAGAGMWNVEMQIPISTTPSTAPNTDTGINLPSSGDFGFYLNVIRVTNSSGTLYGAEIPWPESAPLSPSAVNSQVLSPQRNTPDPSAWGSGRLASQHACNGVGVEYGDITITHGGTSTLGTTEISTVGPNTFNVTPHNDGVNSAGTYVPADGVRAVFRLANRGIPAPADWEQVADTTPAETIPAATATAYGMETLSTSPWLPDPADVADYLANPSQCVLVELHSDVPGTTFKRRSAWTNMRFVSTSSPFQDRAEIGTRGYELPSGANEHEFFLSTHAYNTAPSQRWQTRIPGAENLQEGLFSLRVRQGASARLDATVTPPDAVRIPGVRRPVGTGGTPTVVPVSGGGVVTVIAEGTVQLPAGVIPGAGAASVSPWGADLSRLDVPAGVEFPLSARQRPLGRVGALIGTWDNARDASFVVGPGATLRVPAGASSLTLSLNLPARRQAEGAFQVQTVATGLPAYVAATNSLLGRDPRHERLELPVGANLPTWITCGHRRTGRTLELDGERFEHVEDVGCYGSMIRETGRQ